MEYGVLPVMDDTLTLLEIVAVLAVACEVFVEEAAERLVTKLLRRTVDGDREP